MFRQVLFIALFAAIGATSSTEIQDGGNATGDNLMPFVRRYQKLGAGDTQITHNSSSQTTLVQFRAFGRLFRALLRPDTTIFAPNASVTILARTPDNSSEAVTRRYPLSATGLFLRGHLLDDNNRTAGSAESGDGSVFGTVHHGFLDGSIRTRDDEFFVESADKFFEPASGNSSGKRDFVAVVYRASDVLLWPEPDQPCTDKNCSDSNVTSVEIPVYNNGSVVARRNRRDISVRAAALHQFSAVRLKRASDDGKNGTSSWCKGKDGNYRRCDSAAGGATVSWGALVTLLCCALLC